MGSENPLQIVPEKIVDALADRVVMPVMDFSTHMVVTAVCLSRLIDEELERVEANLRDLRDHLRDDAKIAHHQLMELRRRSQRILDDIPRFRRRYHGRPFCICQLCLAYNASDLLRRVEKLLEDRKKLLSDARPLDRSSPPRIVVIHPDVLRSTMVGVEEPLRQIEEGILDEGVRIIGIWGMPDTGKTSLLKIINNDFLAKEVDEDKFDVVIWVDVSREVQIHSIQRDIAKRLEWPLSDNPTSDSLSQKLSARRFVLLLDDVQERLDVNQIGIPLRCNVNNQNKILFTTRSRQVCCDMKADRLVYVNRLDVKRSYELFFSNAGIGAQEFDQGYQNSNSSETTVGVEEMLRQIRYQIEEKDVIGLYRKDGFANISLLKILEGSVASGSLDRIWVFNVPKEKAAHVCDIQKFIADKLHVKLPADDDEKKKLQLAQELSKKQFILLLDDVREKLDLAEIGLPLASNISNHHSSSMRKILFTTRFEQVCHQMKADSMARLDVGFLVPQKSWELFSSRFCETVPCHKVPDIQKIAKFLVEACEGLPRALVTRGEMMANARTVEQWKFQSGEISDTAVIKKFMTAYDNLKTSELKDCLMFCALFPPSYPIPKDEIIDYWIYEGLLATCGADEPVDINSARLRGSAYVIRVLEDSLELRRNEQCGVLKLPIVVHQMLLGIARSDCLLLAGDVQVVPKSSIWESARRISLIGNEHIQAPPSWNLSCRDLTTLLLQDSTLARNLQGKGSFFGNMPALRVLNLKGARVTELPIEITSLTCLQYLNLSDNDFFSIPRELGALKNLRQLILGFNKNLRSIPGDAIAPLSNLRVLDLWLSDYWFGRLENQEPPSPQLMLDDLSRLQKLSELSISVGSWETLGVIDGTPVLQRSIRKLFALPLNNSMFDVTRLSNRIGQLTELLELRLEDNWIVPVEGGLAFDAGQLQNLQFLSIASFKYANISVSNDGTQTLFPKLRELRIKDSGGFSDLTWVGSLPRLEILELKKCWRLKQVLQEGYTQRDNEKEFPMLEKLTLCDLEELHSISVRPLNFPSLQSLDVKNCPLLKRLPFSQGSAINLSQITGQRKWWDAVELHNIIDKRCLFDRLFKQHLDT